MQTANDIFNYLQQQLAIEDPNERRAISYWLLNHYLGLSRADVIAATPVGSNEIDWAAIIARLNQNEPVQYVTGETEFYGRPFYVTPDVLIPRPETEELVQLVLAATPPQSNPAILDIGTGSGSIAITLAKERPEAAVTAFDVSPAALEVARQNAARNAAIVDFRLVDILQQPPALNWDVIVSNPPYVTESEKTAMQPNVLNYEPHLALFVADSNPLLFYEVIGKYATQNLRPGGGLFLEINQAFGPATKQLLESLGFREVSVKKDMQQNDRFVVAYR